MVAPTQQAISSTHIDLTAQVRASLDGARDAAVPRARSARRDARGSSKKASLGTNGKSASGTVPDAEAAVHSQRVRRFKLQVTAGELAGGRVSYCGRRRKRSVDDVQVMRGTEGESYFAGVQRCSSVHCCPVCAARIAQQRRMETIHALASWRAEGGVVSMLTLTLPHNAGQSLDRVLSALTQCTRYLNSGRNSMKSLLSAYGYHGQIRAAEVTHGENGWHPHLHVLVFTRDLVPAELVDVLKARWEAAATSMGWAAPNWTVGATWQDGQNAAEYVNKAGTWGMAEEATMGTSKKGSAGGRVPFELLLDAALGCTSSAGLFEEYARNLHGKRQLFWSRGLKDYFGIADLTDEQITDQDDENTDGEARPPAPEVLAIVVPDSWRLVVKYEQRAEILRAAEQGGQLAVDFVCTWLFERYLREIRVN